jgi:photosystem II stability/assembly factor-like uncharacterized protein
VSKDRGATWQVKHTGTESLRGLALSLAVPAQETWIVAGNDGPDAVVLISTDDMDTWQRRVVQTNASIADIGNVLAFDGVSPVDAVAVVGAHGLFLQSSDAGMTWSDASSPPIAADLRAIDPEGIVVGDSTALAQQGDGHWTMTQASLGTDYRDVNDADAIASDAFGRSVFVFRPNQSPPDYVQDMGVRTTMNALVNVNAGLVDSQPPLIAVGDGGTILFRYGED